MVPRFMSVYTNIHRTTCFLNTRTTLCGTFIQHQCVTSVTLAESACQNTNELQGCKKSIPFHFPADVLLLIFVTDAGSVDSRPITWTFVSLSLGSVNQPSDEHSFPHSTSPAELQAASSRNMTYVQKFYDSQMLNFLSL